ncbi:unnamed protein product [Paramecium sonneborni]|uniref:B box-type domain-containing protein n=1 Tax=Paramecium sonneborni TaxID=65129 RepID=A0A8S1PJG2_9CILI|nr:unnamed protein product [Paramecium sonneborni]
MSTLSTICQKHIKHIEAFCSDDCSLLCINCILYDGHKGHQFQSLDDSLRMELNRFYSISENVQQNHQKAIKQFQQLAQMNDQLDIEYQRLNIEITKFFNSIRQSIQERESKLQEQLNQSLINQKQQISQSQQKLQVQLQDITDYLQELSELDEKSQDPIKFLQTTQNRTKLINKLPKSIFTIDQSIKFPEINKDQENQNIIKILSKKTNSQQVIPAPPTQQTASTQQKIVQSIKKHSNTQPQQSYNAQYQQQQNQMLQLQSQQQQHKKMNQSKKVPLCETNGPCAVQINLKKKVEEKQINQVRLTNFQEARNMMKERNYDKSIERRKDRDHSTPRRLFKNQSKVSQDPSSPFIHQEDSKQDFNTFLNSIHDFEPELTNVSHMSMDYQYITIGGFVDSLKQIVEKYDIKTDYASEKDQLKNNRCKFGIAHLINGNVLLMGGKVDGVRNDTCEEYNYKDKKVIGSKIKLPSSRSGFGTLNVNQFIYIIGGNDGQENLKDFDCFNQIDNNWIKFPTMIEARDELAVCMYENAIFAIGGFGGQFNTCLKTVEVFTSGKWGHCAPLNIPRRALAGVSLPDGIYAIGGFDGTQYLNSVEKYEDGRWTLIESMIHPRCTLSALSTPDNQYIYVFGGFDNGPLDSVEKYSVLSGNWEQINSLLAKRFMHQTFITLA